MQQSESANGRLQVLFASGAARLDAGVTRVGAALAPLITPLRPVAPVFDAFVPGLGHAIAGRRRLAAVFGLPTLTVLLLLVAAILVVSPARLAAEAVNALTLILALQVLVLAWRLLAVGTSLEPGIRANPRRARTVLPAVLLVAFVVVPQVWVGVLTNAARDALDRVFTSELAPVEPDALPFNPDAFSGDIATPSVAPASPTPAPPAFEGRVNVLILGLDSGPSRTTSLTDTMIIASLDPRTYTVSMLSIPRDMIDIPMRDGRKFHEKINALDTYARLYPKSFPAVDGVGREVLMNALGDLVGLDIKYYAAVNLPGFVNVVNAIGGVDVKVANQFCDPTYHEYGFTKGFSITAGWHHLNGQEALAYARVRKANGESDFTRSARQQEVLSGLRDGMIQRGLWTDPIGLLTALGNTVQTNVPREMVPSLAEAMGKVDRTRTYRTVIDYPLVVSDLDPSLGSVQVPNIKGIKALAARIFPPEGLLPAAEFAVVPQPVAAAPDASATASATAAASASPGKTLAPGKSAPPSPTPIPVPSTYVTSDGGSLTGGAPTDVNLTSGVGNCIAPPAPRATPTPVPTPSPSPSPSSSASPSPSPSGSGGPKPTPTPTPKPSPTPTPTPKPSPTPTPSPTP